MTPDFNGRVIPFALHPLGMLDVFIKLGFSLPELLCDTGVNPNQITQKQLKISYVQLTCIIENVLAQSPVQGLGLWVGKSMGWHFHGAIGGVVYSSPSLVDAYVAFCRYLQIAQPIYKLFLFAPDYYFDRDDYLVSKLHTLIDPALSPSMSCFELEFRLATLARLYQACGSPHIIDTSIEIGVSYPPPEYSDLFRALPVTQVKFNCPFSYIAVHRDFFMKPWRNLRKPLFEKLIDQCEIEFSSTHPPQSFSEQLEWVIYRNHSSELRLQDAAEQLRMSTRALARRLAGENTSFRNIQDRLRAQRAQCHLRHSRLPQEKIADLLGFSSAASLRRAAK